MSLSGIFWVDCELMVEFLAEGALKMRLEMVHPSPIGSAAARRVVAANGSTSTSISMWKAI